MGGFLGQGKDSGSYSYDESKQMIRQLNHKLK